ncbi:transcription initiation factor IIB [Candidatus Bathyarchaeota archaeon]|nr:transcription initiation factor IIB [Candidatus Bathyarchaeota archaeon]
MKEETVISACPRCGSTSLISDHENGEMVCSKCGLVVEEELIDRGPEWRAFTMAEKDSRTRTGLGMSYTLYDKGLSTVFNGSRDAQGNRLKDETRIKMDRLRRYDNRSKFDETWRRNLSIAMAELDRMATALHLPQSVKEQSALIYRKALKMDLIRGRSIDAFVAASIYAACRQDKVPRPLKAISTVSTREHSEVARTYRLLIREMKLKMPLDDPMKFIPSIASKLNLRRDTEQQAIEILRKAKELQGLSGKDPRGLAAAALYMACIDNDDKRIQKEVAAAAGTTEVTLRNRLRGLEATLRTEPEPVEQEISSVAE